ncbi:MAG: ABC transporter substrate-binding protein [Clostridiales bacterium]|nr:ABC transporter substrate-binding protein [Clostridiales bacterium]
MKRLLALILGCAMMFSLVGTAMAEPAVGGELIYGTTTEISGDWAHGAIWTNNATDNTIRGLINDYSTVSFDQGGAMVINQSVTESIDSVMNEDGSKTFTVKIKDDLVFNDGSPISAKHFVANALLFSHNSLIALGSKYTGYIYFTGGEQYKNGGAVMPEIPEDETEEAKAAREEAFKAAVAEGVAKGNVVFPGVRLLDDYTYSLTIVAEYIPYFYDLSYASLSPLSIDMWLGEGYDVKDDGEGAYLVGDMSVETLTPKVEKARFLTEGRITAGPYSLVSYDVGAKQAVLEINPNYKGNFEGQKPHVQKLIIVKSEKATQFDALSTGQINLLSSLTGGEEVNKALDIENGGGFSTVNYERNGYGKLMFQCDFSPTQFKAVRHAIAHLLDRPEFASTFTGGYGALVHGPYGLAMWMYKDAEEELNEKLNAYPYSLDEATKLLVEDGWTLDAEGKEWTEGIRYKKVTEQEAGQYEHNIKLADGTVLMPLIIEWASTTDNPVSELLVTMLANNKDVATAGIEIRQSVMDFDQLLLWMYRDKTQGEQYGVPKFGMFNLATNFNPIYDPSFTFTLDPEKVALGYNVNFLFDEQLDKLSMDMVYGVESTDPEGFLKLWVEYIDLWNEDLPEIPLYSNVYYSIFADKLKNYTESSLWDFDASIVYAHIEE